VAENAPAAPGSALVHAAGISVLAPPGNTTSSTTCPRRRIRPSTISRCPASG